ncbi:MAG TPA: EamA/RhaT family transporter, partial [Chloroflexi bacterium]|nr:EamA/RhaT family transporter [Chloroflexota bacterium]
TILAIILLRETPALMEVAGGVLVLLGILMSTYQRHPAGREEVRPA